MYLYDVSPEVPVFSARGLYPPFNHQNISAEVRASRLLDIIKYAHSLLEQEAVIKLTLCGMVHEFALKTDMTQGFV